MRSLLILVAFVASASISLAKGSSMNFVDTGKKGGLAVVLIHAFPLNQSMWDAQVEALKGDFRVITFDVRGLGKSPYKGPYTLEFVVDDLFELLDKRKISKSVICGLSMGGYVALRALERDPNRLVAAVLADTRSEPDSDKSKLGRYTAIKTINTSGLPALVDEFLKKSIASGIQSQDPKVMERAKKMALANTAEGVSAALLAITSRTDTTENLNRINIPTLVMQGEFDSVVPMDAARKLHQSIPGSEFFIVPKAGHLSNLENPEAFNNGLTAFLRKLKP